MATDQEIAALLENLEAAQVSEEAQGDTPEDTQNWEDLYKEQGAELAKAQERIAVLEEQNQRLFDGMSRMVKSIPVTTEAPKPPQTEAQRNEELQANFDIRKLDFT